MIPFAIFLLELILLFFSSKIVIQALARIFSLVTRSHKVTVYLLAFLFFPGTVVHEVSHLFMAMILGVPVGDVELFPKINGEEVKLGSVQVARSDPFRRFFIGIAPLVVGLAVVFLILSYIHTIAFGWWWLLAGYALFVITNTMFSSKKDMEEAWVFFVAIILIAIAVIVFKIQLPTGFYERIIGLAQDGSWLLVFPLAINGVVYLLATVIKSK